MTPYRTPARLPVRRPLVHLARVVLDAAGESWWSMLFPSPYQWRWIRRAIGGAWEVRLYWTIPGAPEVWTRHGDTTGPGTFRVIDREVWP